MFDYITTLRSIFETSKSYPAWHGIGFGWGLELEEAKDVPAYPEDIRLPSEECLDEERLQGQQKVV